jgi:hypothetical protein
MFKYIQNLWKCISLGNEFYKSTDFPYKLQILQNLKLCGSDFCLAFAKLVKGELGILVWLFSNIGIGITL